MSTTIQRDFSVEVVSARTADEALALLQRESFALVMVNRLLDADGTTGLELIQRIKADEQLRQVPVMLISNYPEAQAEAEQAGAVPGFGKAALGESQTVDRLRPFLT
jgi:two-component system chemotaxis response regulator CheY